jgi:hypothetical protein
MSRIQYSGGAEHRNAVNDYDKSPAPDSDLEPKSVVRSRGSGSVLKCNGSTRLVVYLSVPTTGTPSTMMTGVHEKVSGTEPRIRISTKM